MDRVLKFGIVLLVLPCLCRSLEKEDKIALIEEYVAEYLECSEIPGIGLAVVKDGDVIVAKGYGYADLRSRIMVEDDTLFCIGSCTKAFTTAVLALVLDKHGLEWGSRVSEVLDDFYMATGYMTNQTSMSDIVAHKTGVPGHWMMWLLDQGDRQPLLRRFQFLQPITPFRTEFLYNSWMYMLAGMVTEHLEVETWENLVKQYIFEPIGMNNSTFLNTAGPEYSGFATPYVLNNGEYTKVPYDFYSGCKAISPAGCLVSSAADMVKWLMFLLSDGENGSPEEIVKQTFQTEFHVMDAEKKIPEDPVTLTMLSDYARGWFKGFYRGNEIMSHRGDLTGYHSHVSLFPDYKLGIYHSSNLPDPFLPRRLLHLYVSDIMLDQTPWFNASMACDMQQSTKEDKLFSSAASTKPKYREETTNRSSQSFQHDQDWLNKIEAYVGLYGNFAYGNATTYLNDEEDLLQMQYGLIGYFDLIPTAGEHSFKAVGNRSPADLLDIGVITFEEGDEGSIQYLVIPSFEFSDPPRFERGLKEEDVPLPSPCP